MTNKEPQGEGLLLTDEQIKRYGYGWMQNYDYEIKALLLAQVAKLLSLGYRKLPAPGTEAYQKMRELKLDTTVLHVKPVYLTEHDIQSVLALLGEEK